MGTGTPALPSSYTSLSFQHITLSHVPLEALTATSVILVTLNRAEKSNAFTSEMEHDLVRAFELLDADDRVKAIVVTGKGKMFCAGADLDIGLARQKGVSDKDHRDGGGRVVLAIHRCRKPTIAAIQGSAVGVGITMTLPMAIRIISATAKVGFVFSRRGLIMEACSSFFLPRLIGYSRALYLTTTGSVFPASSPYWGDLFNEVLPTTEQVLPRALELASEIASKTSTISTSLMRELMWRNPGSAEATHLLDSEVIYQLFDSKDVSEGVNSFLEKRPPNFTSDLKTGTPGCVPWWNPIDVVPRRKEVLAKARL